MKPRLLDLDPESRRALQFDEVLALVAGFAVTPMGADRLRSGAPLAEQVAIEREHGAVEEAASYLEVAGRLVRGGLADPRPTLDALALEPPAVDAPQLAGLARVLLAADDLAGRLDDLDTARFPRLSAMAASLPDLAAEATQITEHVSPEGRLLDGASPELRRVRRATTRLRERLHRELTRLVRDPGEAGIRDDFVTQRSGRYVVPVRADAPRSVQGIVHASSSSGATLFVEPLQTVELNNELVRLIDAEREEERRVIRGWALTLRDRRADVELSVEQLTVADTLQARAAFAAEAGAVRPRLDEGGGLQLDSVRHPLLDRRLAARGARSVPLDLRLAPPQTVLVLSGPNTGGKTVALKTVGLAVLMAQAGLPVCARRARLPVLARVRADIGDHQSISADLSTFSAHLRAVSAFLAEAQPPGLFLFDEIGTGTEPHEGAALAQAVLERLAGSGVLTMATTHLGPLKAWAFTSAEACCAATEFDMATLRPTYRVLSDVAGSSAGLEIAARLGLQREVVERARELLDGESRQAESYLMRLRERLAQVDEERRRLGARGEELERERARIAELDARDRERHRRQAERVLDEALEGFRRAARREVAGLEEAKERTRMAKRVERATARLRHEARQRRLEATGDAGPAGEGEAGAPERIEPGVAVRVRSLGREGEVLAVQGRQVRVRLGNSMFTVDRGDLAAPRGEGAGRKPAVRVDVARADSGEVSMELKLIGRRVDEALTELDRFLDRAVMAGLVELRVVHGHGTGRLRAAVRRFLDEHPVVERHRPGGPAEGGEGATVVRLRG